jgi:hypothetical protein
MTDQVINMPQRLIASYPTQIVEEEMNGDGFDDEDEEEDTEDDESDDEEEWDEKDDEEDEEE